MIIDDKTKEYFKNIKQVFLYIGDRCNLLCEQCLYKPNVVMGKQICKNTAEELLAVFANLGAYKLTLLGGEISLYDYENNWDSLKAILKYAREIGYRYIRIDTNGQIQRFFDDNEILQYLDEVSFSVDGYNSESNDILRGRGAFVKAIESIEKVIQTENPPNVNITTCVTRQNTEIAGGIEQYIKKMISFSESLGVNQINFHGVFKMGVSMDTWTGNSHLDPAEWNKAIECLLNDEYYICRANKIRLPLHVISREKFDKHPKYYGYCPCKLGERALIHPDGIIRVCSSMLSTPYGVAHYTKNRIEWNDYNNELCNHKMKDYTPCTNQVALYSDTLCPVCFSIKPHQNEIIWNESDVEGLRDEV